MARVPRLGAECLYPCNCKKPVHTISILISIAINYGIFLKFLTPANCDPNIINIHVALGRNIGTQVIQGPNSMPKGRDLSHAEGYIYIYISINVPNVHVITSTTTELHAEHLFSPQRRG